MNIFNEIGITVLNRISVGDIEFEKHLEYLKNSITQKIKSADNIIICGLTHIGKKCLSGIKRYTDSDIFIFDIRSDSSAPPRPGILNI